MSSEIVETESLDTFNARLDKLGSATGCLSLSGDWQYGSQAHVERVFTVRRVCITQTVPWQDVYLSHASIVSKRLYISSNFFHCQVAPPF